jgi:hypothetical protein
MTRAMTLRCRIVFCTAAAFAGLALPAVSRANGDDDSNVYPADARPYGFTLDIMAQRLALFTTNGNDPKYYPQTPFQILYAVAPFANVAVGNGLVFAGGNTFTVARGTPFYVPIQNVDDSPAILLTFPKTAAQAIPYVFSPAFYGGQDFYVFVDGEATELGSDYVAGPVKTPPLGDGGGTHIITVGAFIKPLPPGDHTVRITGHIGSAALLKTYGVGFEDFLFIYIIHVNK